MSVGEQPYQGDEALSGLLKKVRPERGFDAKFAGFSRGLSQPRRASIPMTGLAWLPLLPMSLSGPSCGP